jgi:hypothetical protein
MTMSEQRYYVVGGEYADTSFTNPAPGVELERHGPLSEDKATALWRSLTGRSVDNAMVRYFLKPVDESTGKKYWVVGGEYADSTFTRLAPARELEVFGPFEKWEALGFWRGLTSKSVDDALVRYEIRKDYTPTAPKVALSAPALKVRTKTKSIAIAAPPEKVFAYLADGGNWPQWALHNIKSAKQRSAGVWDIQTPRGAGSLTLKFDQRTGILDHTFADADATTWTVPGRLIPSDGGSLVIMTFLKPAAMSESEFATGMAQLDEELAILRGKIEAR